jgi:16S rRNA (adenine1518-N6/adenine1519-N6)-dimethyltransferase
MTRQRLGQHFLTDATWRERIAATLNSFGGTWLEIGAGHGEMTALLSHGAEGVVAVELDPPLVQRLRERASQWPNVQVVAGDILELDLSALFEASLLGAPLPGADRIRVYGNLPYYITSPILHRLFAHAEQIESMHFVVQWEVAKRLVAKPGGRDYAYLSVLTQFYSRPEISLRIPPGAFRPRPKVMSALVRLSLPGERARLSVTNEARFLEFVKTCFAQKRKTLANNLRELLGEARARELIRAAGLRSDARAEQVTVVQFARLFRIAA